MNWVWWARLRSASAKRPMLASSSAASTSSRTQNGTGRTSSMANSRATAVRARWPRDDLDAGRAQVGRVGQRQPGEATAEQLLESVRKGALQGGERRPEPIRD